MQVNFDVIKFGPKCMHGELFQSHQYERDLVRCSSESDWLINIDSCKTFVPVLVMKRVG